MRTPRYRSIAAEIRARLDAGDLGNDVLPSESELCAVHGASRSTVRRALELLRDEGLLDVRQGYGWFLRVDPLRQSLGRLGTIEGQLAALGRVAERRILDFGFVSAPPRIRVRLGARTVLRVRRLNLADGQPFARITVWCPEDLASGLSRDDVAASPFYELLDVQLGGATQSIASAAASASDAKLLEVPVGSPVLVCDRVTSDSDGRAVLCSEHVYPGHLTEFVVDLPHVEPSIVATGLRLVGAPGEAVSESLGRGMIRKERVK